MKAENMSYQDNLHDTARQPKSRNMFFRINFFASNVQTTAQFHLVISHILIQNI